MKFLAALVATATSVFCSGLFAQESNADAIPVNAPVALPSSPLSHAEASAASWLAVADAGGYARSWREAAGLLQGAITQAQWESALQASRVPLGGVMSRTLKAATYSHTLAGVPDGEYVLIQYETRFASKSLAIETLTIMKDQDTRWKVAGYFIK